MRFSYFVRVAFIAVLLCGFAQDARATLCSDPALRNAMTTGASNAAKTREQAIAKGWKAPSAFNSLYCGAQIKSMFGAIGTGLGGAFYAMINTLLTNLINQACASAIAPIQNAASQLCIPFFSMANFNINLGLTTPTLNMCNGTQLFSVTPVMTRPATTVPSNASTPTTLLP
jgi:hypothetical protein